MKLLVHTESEDLFCMANLVPKRTGLSAYIFSEHSGVQRNVQHNVPRVKISTQDSSISVSIEAEPRILAGESTIKSGDSKALKGAIDYVGRNYDLFLQHYMDTEDAFDDQDLFDALKSRNDFR